MRENDIHVGETYHNGLNGLRRTERKVTRIIGNIVKFQTVKGRRTSLEVHHQQDGDILLHSFAVWAQGRVKKANTQD